MAYQLQTTFRMPLILNIRSEMYIGLMTNPLSRLLTKFHFQVIQNSGVRVFNVVLINMQISLSNLLTSLLAGLGNAQGQQFNSTCQTKAIPLHTIAVIAQAPWGNVCRVQRNDSLTLKISMGLSAMNWRSPSVRCSSIKVEF